MFEYEVVSRLQGDAALLAQSPASMATSQQNRDTLRAIQHVQDLLNVAKAQHLAELDRSGEFEEDGASTLGAWVRSELRLDAAQARTLVAAGDTIALLPTVGEAAKSGSIRLEHVKQFTASIRSVGLAQIRDAQPWLVEVAQACSPGELAGVIRSLRDVVHSDALDAKWAQGMDKSDIRLDPVPDGWHLTGFLPIEVGARVKAVLDSVAVPRDKDDERSPAQRRIDGLDAIFASVLEHGLPTDRGVRPQLHVMVDHDTAQAQLAQDAKAGAGALMPAELTGFGAIGPQLLSYLACNTDVTGILTHGETGGDVPQARILNVGRTSRLATYKQRQAVLARQRGICAAPGCKHTHLELHHVIWWKRDKGKTDLDVLIGLCRRCHLLIHSLKLFVYLDGQGGFVITRRARKPWPTDATRRLARTPRHIQHVAARRAPAYSMRT